MIKLVEPTLNLKEKIEDFKNESLTDSKIEIHGSSLLAFKPFDEWIKFVEDCKKKETCPKNFVTAHTFLIIDNSDNILGIINLRHELNDYLLNFGGNIGYSIRPSQRRKGYAKTALKLACEFLFNEIGLEKVLVTCNKENIASKKTIEACGGIFENETKNEYEIMLRYWIYNTVN